MELKTYQKNVISDLSRFLALLTEKQSIPEAYKTLWEEKNVAVDIVNGMPPYRTNLSGVPEVCFKVPTGGGKTFLAASSIKPIFDSMPQIRAKAVVWLVPSDAILTQTYAALSNPAHPYRQKIDVDFSGAVAVYSKAQLLNGQGFSPTSVREQLSIFVLSYDSFRTSNKEGRKAYQENGNLAMFPKMMQDKSAFLQDVDETALIQAIRSLNPVVIVDESHHATSTLSQDMLKSFRPCFVLDLTATPKKNSNIISFVDAMQLKKANMVKLPVIVYNRKTQNDVFVDAISIRQKLENQAKIEQRNGGRYIRPIVLFQAQPKNSTDSTTYEKIKATLVDAGIPQDQIAIKTSEKDELKKVDLLSPDCPIRYIITVNALKEGWDCPFAYVLATVANRTSAVDVEQILGRVLRLPYTEKKNSNVLNLSYVITSSANFGQTLDKVVVGLNNAGFSNKDYRAKDVSVPTELPAPIPEPEQLPIPEPPAPEPESDTPEIDVDDLRSQVQTLMTEPETETAEIESDPLLAIGLEQNAEYEEATGNDENSNSQNLAPQEVRERMDVFHMTGAFKEEASALQFPQFMLRIEPNFISDAERVFLSKAHLSEGFTLRGKDAQIDFSTVDTEMARVDIDERSDFAPKAWQLKGAGSAYFKDYFNAQPSDKRMEICKRAILLRLSRIDCIDDHDLTSYIDRVVETMTEDQLSDLQQSVYPYSQKIEEKIESLLEAYRIDRFNLWVEQGKIECCDFYRLPTSISPIKSISRIPKSLFAAEEDMNEYEQKVVWALSSLGNIKWWHRNISRRGFQINGPVHAYPDIIAMTESGKILMVETKGDHLDNDESKEKAKIGHQWASLAGSMYRYFMVFETKSPNNPGAYSYDRFMEIVKGL